MKIIGGPRDTIPDRKGTSQPIKPNEIQGDQVAKEPPHQAALRTLSTHPQGWGKDRAQESSSKEDPRVK